MYEIPAEDSLMQKDILLQFLQERRDSFAPHRYPCIRTMVTGMPFVSGAGWLAFIRPEWSMELGDLLKEELVRLEEE